MVTFLLCIFRAGTELHTFSALQDCKLAVLRLAGFSEVHLLVLPESSDLLGTAMCMPDPPTVLHISRVSDQALARCTARPLAIT